MVGGGLGQHPTGVHTYCGGQGLQFGAGQGLQLAIGGVLDSVNGKKKKC